MVFFHWAPRSLSANSSPLCGADFTTGKLLLLPVANNFYGSTELFNGSFLVPTTKVKGLRDAVFRSERVCELLRRLTMQL
jgi:hypothetical protein